VIFNGYSVQPYKIKFDLRVTTVLEFFRVLCTASVTCDRLVVFSGYSVQFYEIKLVSNLRQVSDFLWVLCTVL